VFTGIIESVGRLLRKESVGNRLDLDVEVGAEIAGSAAIGESIALDGCCLTVVSAGETSLRFQAVRETGERTALGDRADGDPLNVERAMRADSRLGGHFVLGHVDGTGRVSALERLGDDVCMEIACPAEIMSGIVPKGSVAIDGVSLTVVDVSKDRFSVALIPHTLQHTTLGVREVGDRVNLEVDVLGKYVLRYLEQAASGRGPGPRTDDS
jgi:riboflavin synthase alpha subunit